MGLGFSLALTCIGAVREILAAGSIFGFRIMPDSYVTINIFGLAPGAFFVLAALTALQNYIKNKRKLAGKDYEKTSPAADMTVCTVARAAARSGFMTIPIPRKRL